MATFPRIPLSYRWERPRRNPHGYIVAGATTADPAPPSADPAFLPAVYAGVEPRLPPNVGFVAGSPATLTATPPAPAPFFETDWPNPTLRKVQRLDWEDSFKLPLQQIIQPNQYDWPNPVLRTVQRQDWIFPQAYVLNFVAPVPFVQTDWPNPKGPRPLALTWTDSFKLSLQQVIQKNQYDWPNPRGQPPRPYFSDSFKLPLQQTVQANQYNWPNPRGPLPPRQDWILSQPYTLNVADFDLGFNLWGLPERQRRNLQDWIFPQPYTLNFVVAANPVVPIDWPNPRGPAARQTSFTDSFKLPLQQTIQGNQYNWPNPVLRTVQRQDWQQSTSIALSTAVAPPFFETEWPNPVLRVVQRKDWADRFKLPLQQTLPPRQLDWPNPRGPRQSLQDWILSQPCVLVPITDPAVNYLGNPFQIRRSVNFLTWLQPKVLEAPVVVEAPQVPIDWPNPVRRTVQRQDWILSQPYVLNVVVVAYDLGFNLWGLPDRARRGPQDWIAGTNLLLTTAPVVTVNPGFNEWAVPSGPLPRLRPDWIFPQPYTLNVVVAANPFVPRDFPNPRGPAPRQTSFTDSFKLPLQQTLPPHQTDWPNPLGPRRGPQDWIQATSIALSTSVQPFAQSDWSNPRAARPSVRDWSDSFKLPLQQTLPPRQLDWPNPGRRKPPVVADWIQSTSIASTFVQAPFTQRDWPNPTRRKINLLPTWTDAFKLPLQQTLPPRQLDWPVPKGPRQPVITTRDFYMGIRPEPPIPPEYDSENTLKNEIRRLRFLDNKTGRVRFLKNEIRR